MHPKLEQVAEIQVEVTDDYFAVGPAISARYGSPVRDIGIWIRDTPHIIAFRGRKGGKGATITFGFDPIIAKNIKRQSGEKKNRSETLKSF